jgi:membrane protease subunit HflK
MPWSNQGGGGWRGGGPWGPGPQPSGPTPPDLEELLRRSQDRIRRVLPGGSVGGLGLLIAALVLLGVWAASGIYTVRPNEVGVVQRFGKYAYQTGPGLNYHWPYPIETALTPDVLERKTTTIGMRMIDDPRRPGTIRDVPEESLMLTGDENIVDVDFTVFWRVKDAKDYLFNIQMPEGTVKAVGESAMREVIGRSNIQPILTQARQNTENAVQDLMQRTLDDYGAGVVILQVQMLKVDPPAQVIDAFRDVQAARADQERVRNEAQAYANRVVPEARGEAARIVQQAEGYRERAVAEAQGQASRFLQVNQEYAKAPELTRERLYLETLERVLGGMDKTIVDPKLSGGTGVVPYLSLNPAEAKAAGQTGQTGRRQP